MISRQLPIIGFLLLELFQGCHGQAQRTLYGTTGKISEASVLYIIDPTTGRGTRINKIKYQSQALTVNGMAFDTTDRQFGGQMYIHTGPYSPNYPNSLFSLDVTNGVATLISETMLPQVGQLAIDQFGTRYGWQFGGLNQRIDDLVKFRQNGQGAELFGDSGITTVGNIGIDFDRQDATSLYMVNFNDGGVQVELLPFPPPMEPVRPCVTSIQPRLPAVAANSTQIVSKPHCMALADNTGVLRMPSTAVSISTRDCKSLTRLPAGSIKP
jgi:hypothetical protein